MRVRTLGLVGLSALMLAGTAGTVRAQAPARKAWVHVRVEEANRQSKVSVNLPVTVVEAALQAAPEDILSHGHIHLGKMGKRATRSSRRSRTRTRRFAWPAPGT
jgi:hypothetical protein